MRDGWELRKLGDLFTLEYGKPLDKSKRKPDGKYPAYGANGVLDRTDEFLVGEKSIIVGRKGSAGEINYTEEKFWPLDVTYYTKFDRKNLDLDFLFYLLKLLNLPELAKGVKPGINRNDVYSIETPIPPLPEQQKIVSILDETFAALDQAKANLEQNLQNAKELFQSELNSIFSNKGDDWVDQKFENLITTLTDYHANGGYKTLKENVELKETEDYAWMVRSTDFENNFKNDLRYIDEEAFNFLRKSKIFGGEIIISKIGNAGKVYLMPKVDRPCSLAMNLFLIRLDEEKAIPGFIYQYLNSINGEIQIKSRLLGTTTKTITKDNIRSILIPIPPLQEQHRIVAQLDNLSTETKKLETLYQQKLNNLEELRKSVLQKAFKGELGKSIPDKQFHCFVGL